MRLLVTRVSAVLLAAVLLMTWGGNAQAFNEVNARAIAMGGAQVSGSRGVNVVGWNPAYLGFSDNPKVSFYIPAINLGFRMSNNFLSVQEVNKIFVNNKFLTAEDKQQILDDIRGDAWDFYTDFYMPIFGVSFPTPYLNMALTYDVGISANWGFSKEFMDMALNGYGLDELGVTRDFSDTHMRAQVASRVGFTIAKRFEKLVNVDWINELTTGFTFTYYLGHGYGNVDSLQGTMLMDVGVFNGHGLARTTNAGITGNGTDISVDPMAGSGVGLDFGIGAKMLDNRLVAGISVINLMNKINWTNSQSRLNSYAFYDPLSFGDLTGGGKGLEDKLDLQDSLVTDSADITTELPQIVHLNAGYYPFRDLLVSTDLRFNLVDAAGGSKSTRFGAGIEYSGAKVLPLRAGFSVGGRGGFSYGMGLGLYLGPWHTDIGWAWEHGFLDTATGLYFGINTTFMFGIPKPKDDKPKYEEYDY